MDSTGTIAPTATFVPLIDLRAWYEGDETVRAALATDVDNALAASGFLLVTSHGVSDDVRLGLRRAAQAFFALPDDVKARYEATVMTRGYLPVGKEANAYAGGEESPPDLKQGFTFSNEEVPVGDGDHAEMYPPNVWPDEVPELQALVRAWSAEMLRLATDLTELFAAALGLPAAHFRTRDDVPMWTLGLNWYPPRAVVGEPQPGQFRIGPHTDFGVLTILDREVGLGGLQVQRNDGEWMDAPFEAGALTVNLGDLMARWTGDRWRSARHRVLPPPGGADESLLSLVFFDSGIMSDVVETLPAPACGPTVYEPISAAEYLRFKLEQIDV